jgi:cobalamin biosynthesis Mg chelatase CobN
MPKKTTASRNGAQRNRPRAQKSIEVVRQPASLEQESVTDEQTEATPESFATTPAPTTTTARSTTRTAAKTKTATPAVREEPPGEQESPIAVAPKGSAAARLAARRQGQRSQLKSAATLITAEHYTYVKRDLVIIAILASVMFVAIIVLYFILARGF